MDSTEKRLQYPSCSTIRRGPRGGVEDSARYQSDPSQDSARRGEKSRPKKTTSPAKPVPQPVTYSGKITFDARDCQRRDGAPRQTDVLTADEIIRQILDQISLEESNGREVSTGSDSLSVSSTTRVTNQTRTPPESEDLSKCLPLEDLRETVKAMLSSKVTRKTVASMLHVLETKAIQDINFSDTNNHRSVGATVAFTQPRRRRRAKVRRPTGVLTKNETDPEISSYPTPLEQPVVRGVPADHEPASVSTSTTVKVKPHVDESRYLFYKSEDEREFTDGDDTLLHAIMGPHDTAKDSLDTVFCRALKRLAFGKKVFCDEYFGLKIISGAYLELKLLQMIRDYYKKTVGADIVEYLTDSSPDKNSPLAPLVGKSSCEMFIRKLVDRNNLTPANCDDFLAEIPRIPSKMAVWTDFTSQAVTNYSISTRMKSIYKHAYARWSRLTKEEKDERPLPRILATEYRRKMRRFLILHQDFLRNMLRASELMAFMCLGFATVDLKRGSACMAVYHYALEVEKELDMKILSPYWNFPLVGLYLSTLAPDVNAPLGPVTKSLKACFASTAADEMQHIKIPYGGKTALVKPHIDESNYVFHESEDKLETTDGKESLLYAIKGKHDTAKDSLDTIFRLALKELAFGMKEFSDEYFGLKIISGAYLELKMLQMIRAYYNNTIGADIIEYLTGSLPDKESPFTSLVGRSSCEMFIRKLVHRHNLTPDNFDDVLADIPRTPAMKRVWADISCQAATNSSISTYMQSMFKTANARWRTLTFEEMDSTPLVNMMIAEYCSRMEPFLKSHHDFLDKMLRASELMTYMCFGFASVDPTLATERMAKNHFALKVDISWNFESLFAHWNYPLVSLYQSMLASVAKTPPDAVMKVFRACVAGTAADNNQLP